MKTARPTAGSALLAAVLLSVVMAALAGLYLRSVTDEVRNAHRTRLMLETVNVAEAGAEDAIDALLRGDWSGWQAGSHGYSREISLPGGAAGEQRLVRTFMDLNDPDAPRIVSEAVLTHPAGVVARKQIRIELDRRGVFSNGLTSRNGITMNGNNVAVDSYNSSRGTYDPSTNRNDRGSVASTSVEVDAVEIQNADIFGYVATGGAQPKVGKNGSITGWGTPSGVKIDAERVAVDFYADFPPVSAPSELGSIPFSSSTLGFPSVSTKYKISSLSVGSGQVLQVEGNVTLIVDDDIDVKGEIRVNPGATLTVYVGDDVTIGGNGVVNDTNIPANFVLFATGTGGSYQEIKLHGNGALTGAVYAPFAEISMKGGGNSGMMLGAVVGDAIVITGNYEFHYDEALADYGTNGKFSLLSWTELDSADSRYADVLALKDNGL